MSSINTNLGAMVALDTLKGINKNLGMVQNEISTGKSINSAADNAAIWSISTVMETDVAGFEKIGNSLNLGSATLGVARTAAEDVVSNLQDIRDTIVDAQGENVDRDTLQFDIDEAVAQIKSTISGAQFNGQNLLSSSGEISVLSSLDRSADGSVEAASIAVSKANLSTTDNREALEDTAKGYVTATSTEPEFAEVTIEDALAITIDPIADASNYTYDFTVAGTDISVAADASTTEAEVALKIATAINDADIDGLEASLDPSDLSKIVFEVGTGVDATISNLVVTDGTDPVASTADGGITLGDAGDQSGIDNTAPTFVSPLDNTKNDTLEDVQAISLTDIADADGLVYTFEIDGETITYTGASGDSQDDVANGLVAAINDAGIEGLTASVDGTTADQINFEIEDGLNAKISNLTVVDGADDTLVADDDAGGVTLGTAFDQDGLDNSADTVAKTDVKALEIATAAAGEATNNVYEATIGGETASYTALATDTQDDIAAGLVDAINDLEIEGLTAKVNSTVSSQIDFDIGSEVNADVTLTQQGVGEGETLAALAGLEDIDVTTDEGAAAALTAIEGFLNSAIDAASEFGSKQKRIDNQIEFVSSLSDSLKAGISTLTDANLEEASARLQALQVQQQLGIQALSIANQAPQALLGLFR